ncbi:quinone oxidoreductase family protein [Sinorhizobium mexicanum]|uniref:Zinc-binding dehydrogenase n=1 Tax=Sinorhizobium mexicanum TaxID=375549 RepID=A0A859R4F1_9HYPH|nr:zinc-binding dehydrogenase [Sinorhizobium mexicanum]MBP1887337.1 NADPH2:quinone reductase [Sinorhizobium mexicanum]QLL65781.1 zinc-binding dehydrogenase [Sinorhizobium mexicanum]
MKAIQFRHFGPPEVLEIVDIPKRAPAEGEVLVRTRAIGVNFFEVLMREDRYAVTPELPMIPGVEVAGVVEAAGAGVSGTIIGSRVAVPMFAFGRGSGYAEYITIDAATLVPVPDVLPFETATALMIQGLTALHLIRQSPPKGKTILVTAAAGGVGSLLIQLAKSAGARSIVATASSDAKLELVRSLGADIGVDYSLPNWTAGLKETLNGRGIDIIYDLIGGPFTKAALDLLAPGGELVFGALGRFGLGSGEMEAMFSRNQSLHGFALLPLLTAAGLKADLADLFHQAEKGTLRVIDGGRFPLTRAADAHRALESRQTTGKIVLIS